MPVMRETLIQTFPWPGADPVFNTDKWNQPLHAISTPSAQEKGQDIKFKHAFIA